MAESGVPFETFWHALPFSALVIVSRREHRRSQARGEFQDCASHRMLFARRQFCEARVYRTDRLTSNRISSEKEHWIEHWQKVGESFVAIVFRDCNYTRERKFEYAAVNFPRNFHNAGYGTMIVAFRPWTPVDRRLSAHANEKHLVPMRIDPCRLRGRRLQPIF